MYAVAQEEEQKKKAIARNRGRMSAASASIGLTRILIESLVRAEQVGTSASHRMHGQGCPGQVS